MPGAQTFPGHATICSSEQKRILEEKISQTCQIRAVSSWFSNASLLAKGQGCRGGHWSSALEQNAKHTLTQQLQLLSHKLEQDGTACLHFSADCTGTKGSSLFPSLFFFFSSFFKLNWLWEAACGFCRHLVPKCQFSLHLDICTRWASFEASSLFPPPRIWNYFIIFSQDFETISELWNVKCHILKLQFEDAIALVRI